ncbi:hypothetical protein CHELA1G11_60027 [Hyphomicrobiales bacterium]|nr:hypothetical protein CHELA1G2_50026 [Hyphomicrobiales bacterium]CAH1696871.1 hypothetical protein CHELA1G11_60027 [Hyphomicrobiales bacterium]
MPVAAGIIGHADRPAGAAAIDMAAEFGGPAQFDGAHHAALDASEMTVMNLPIRLAMAAEDIRHLQSRRHGRNRSTGRHHLDVQPVERACRAPDQTVRDFGVARRRGKIVVAKQHLDDADIGAVLQQMGGEAVSERVDRPRLSMPAAARAERQAEYKTCTSMGRSRRGRETARPAASPDANRPAGSAEAAPTASPCGLCRLSLPFTGSKVPLERACKMTS